MNIKNIILSKLKKLTSKSFTEESDIYEIGIDSLDLVEMVTEAEEELKIEISDEALESIKTVGDVVKIFEDAIKNKI